MARRTDKLRSISDTNYWVRDNTLLSNYPIQTVRRGSGLASVEHSNEWRTRGFAGISGNLSLCKHSLQAGCPVHILM